MTDLQQNEIINKFFQVFTSSIEKTLAKNLDEDICKEIKFETTSSSKVKDAESLKENNAIYKLDYVIGNRPGTLTVLIPEELIADISDILTGGNGKDAYKGSLSEIETNSSLKIMEKIFKIAEEDFKKKYDLDLAFSANPIFLLKEVPEYAINSGNYFFDFLISNTLNLNEDSQYNVNILLSNSSVENLLKDLGLAKPSQSSNSNLISSMDVTRLADVKINITAELGRTRVPIKYALELVRGSLIELDTLNNADIKVFANGIEFAHAQVVAIEDNFGLKITKIVSPEERMESV